MKKPSVQKPIKPIHQRLLWCWWLWLAIAILGYPLLTMMAGASLVHGVLVQILAMLPVLIFTPFIMRANSPYALIVASLMTLVYLGVAGVLALIRYYEDASNGLWLGRLLEFVVVLCVNYYLFVLLKRLPPMHQTRSES